MKHILLSLFSMLPFIRKQVQRDTLEIDLTEVNISNSKLSGLRLLFISDLHLEVSKHNLSKMITYIKDTKFDYCILGGDYFDIADNIDSQAYLLLNLLNELNPEKTFFIKGNHDNELVLKFMQDQGLCYLNNESIVLPFKTTQFQLTGINNDTFDDNQHTIKNIDESLYNVVISHEPDFAYTTIAQSFNLQLSGHSHNGQIRFFGISPIRNSKKELMNGTWQVGQLHGFTSSGAGMSFHPIRYNTRNQIALIKFQ